MGDGKALVASVSVNVLSFNQKDALWVSRSRKGQNSSGRCKLGDWGCWIKHMR
jgi:hypothetical protein